MDKLSDSCYGWVFEGRDVSQKAAQEYPRDEMLTFSRGSLLRGEFVIERLSVPRYDFLEAVDSLGIEMKKTDNRIFRGQYGEIGLLREQVGQVLCDLI